MKKLLTLSQQIILNDRNLQSDKLQLPSQCELCGELFKKHEWYQIFNNPHNFVSTYLQLGHETCIASFSSDLFCLSGYRLTVKSKGFHNIG